MLAKMARLFHVEESTLRARLVELRSSSKQSSLGASATRPHTVQGLTPHETELFEIMVLHPDLARHALAAIDVQTLGSETARAVWGLYENAAGEEVDLQIELLLTLAEDAELKNLLVRLFDQAEQKAELASDTAEQRLNGLIDDFEERRKELSQRVALAALEKRDYDEEEELRVLERLIEEQRGRQGIPAPTDG